MEKYIALLRGINVGGKNKISMQELKKLFEQNGFIDVITYINSGNIIFSFEDTNNKLIKEKCESLISQKFRLNIPVTVLSGDELFDALNHAPYWWDNDKESKHNAIFVIPPVTVDEVFEKVAAIKPEYEKVGHYGSIIFWSAPIKTFAKTRWSNVVNTSAYDSITIRNSNTVKKLADLAK